LLRFRSQGNLTRLSALTPRRRAIYLGMVILLMLETLKHFTQSVAYLISLWAMEFFVLALIAWEVAHAIWRHHIVGIRLKEMFDVMEKGHALQRSAPRAASAGSVNYGAWIKSVEEWDQQAQTLLKSYSVQAVASFLHDTSGAIPAWYDSITMPAQLKYATLISRLDNLRSIMEKPEIYF